MKVPQPFPYQGSKRHLAPDDRLENGWILRRELKLSMTFLPIVERELRVAARRRGTYWNRALSALIAILIGGWLMVIFQNQSPHELGLALFVSLAALTFLYCLLAGVRATADCLSEEKREGTLGLLFLTDLKGYDVVFGKLAASSLHAVYGVLAMLPALAIPFLLGGVSGQEFGRVALVALNTLFFSLAAGLFVSACTHDDRKAMMLTFLLLALLTVAPPVMELYRSLNTSGRGFVPQIIMLSPGFTCVMAFDDTYRSLAREWFWASMLWVHVLGWTFLAVACLIVPRSWQDKSVSARTGPWRNLWQRVRLGGEEWRNAFRAQALDRNPFYWLLARERLKPRLVWFFLGVSACLWLCGYLKFRRDWTDEATYIFTALVLHTVLKIWIASEAVQRFVLDRKSGALELLLSTPLSVLEILRGQWLALYRQFAGPLVVVLGADTLFLVAERHRSDWIVLWLAGMTVLVADAFTLSRVGAWMGMRHRRTNRALAATLVRVLVLPWMAFFVIIAAVAVFASLYRTAVPRWWGDDRAGPVLWWALGMANNLIFFAWARRKLRTQFRAAAAERFARRPARSDWWPFHRRGAAKAAADETS